jgi:hypothetical protein
MSDLNEYERELYDWMVKLRDLKKSGGLMEGYAYCGMEDFLLQHGVWYRPAAGMIPPRQGAPKSCFGNALWNAALYKVPYIEGVALPGVSIINGVALPSLNTPRLPVHHGWNLDCDGELCDTTWMNHGLAYLGVEFSVGRADNATWFDDGSVLDNPRNQFKIYREPWTGENFNLVWRQSKPLRQALRMVVR